MLMHSFCCFHGLSDGAERRLWGTGCLQWDGLALPSRAVSERRRQKLIAQLSEMRAALRGRLVGYFLARLPCGHRLRAWPTFHSRTLFVDIETTGLGQRDHITVIGAGWNGTLQRFIRGRNLEEFLVLVGQAELVISFNGMRFDWPVIEREFGCALPVAHIDLMHEARAHGYAGGLKAIERRIGIARSETETGDGRLAVLLWQRYIRHSDCGALERLLAYNRSDVRSLVLLSRKLLSRSMEGYPGPHPKTPEFPFFDI